MKLESELRSLQSQVNRLEATITFLQKEMNDKLSIVMQQFLNHRAVQIAQQKGALQLEEDICRDLITRCAFSTPPPTIDTANGTRTSSKTDTQDHLIDSKTSKSRLSVNSNSTESEENHRRIIVEKTVKKPILEDQVEIDFDVDSDDDNPEIIDNFEIKIEGDEDELELEEENHMEDEEDGGGSRRSRFVEIAEKQLLFVRTLSKYPCLLSKSQKPNVKANKAIAARKILEELKKLQISTAATISKEEGTSSSSNSFPTTNKVLMKKINNMKMKCIKNNNSGGGGGGGVVPNWKSEFIQLLQKIPNNNKKKKKNST